MSTQYFCPFFDWTVLVFVLELYKSLRYFNINLLTNRYESWTIKKAEHQRIDAFELWCWLRLLKSLELQEIQPVHTKRDQSWVFIGRTDVETETPILWPPDAKN